MPARIPLLLLFFFTSGACGLVYELVWTRQLALIFGGTTYAISTVLVAFMGGLGGGSLVAGRLAPRLARPIRGYAVLEILIGLYALAVPLLLSLAEPLYRSLYPAAAASPLALTAARFAIGAVVLFIPSAMMGATLPLLVHVVSARGRAAGSTVGLLYGVNSLGAVCGVLATAFLLIPSFGVTAASRVAVAGNILVGVLALLLLREGAAPVGAETAERKPKRAAPAVALTAPLRRAVFALILVSGFTAMVYQVAWTRALVLSIGSSTYAFSLILAAFILGIAAGSLLITPIVERLRDPLRAIAWVEIGIGALAVLILPAYNLAPRVVYKLVQEHGDNIDALLAVEFALIVAITLGPTLLMGALFPLAVRALSAARGDAAGTTGNAYAWNTLGNILGAFCAGFLFIRSEVLGAHGSIVVAGLMNVVAGAGLIILVSGPSASALKRFGPLIAGLALLSVSVQAFGGWDAAALNSGAFLGSDPPGALEKNNELLYVGDGPDMTVVVRQGRGERSEERFSLAVNGKTDASTSPTDMMTQILIGHLPIVLTPSPREVCVIGLGSGVTLGSVAAYDAVQRIDCVEISEQVIYAANEYFAPFNRGILSGQDPRIRLFAADGRNHLLLNEATYDVIISEPSNPWIAGVANLFTHEFFQLARSRLRPGGTLCVWMHGYRMSIDNFQLVVRTLGASFAHISIWEMAPADYAILATDSEERVPAAEVLSRLAAPAVREDLFRVAIARPEQLLGRAVAGGQTLRAWVGPGELHTDDNARLEFSAPRQLYRMNPEPIIRALDALASPEPRQLMAFGATEDQQRLAAGIADVYLARRLFSEAVQQVEAGRRDVASLELTIRAYELNPGDVDIWRQLEYWREEIEALARRGDPSAAPLLEKLAVLDEFPPPMTPPMRTAPLEQIAYGYAARAARAESDGRLEYARRSLEDAIRVAPEEPTFHLRLAGVLLRLAREDEALAVLQAALDAGWVAHPQIEEAGIFETILPRLAPAGT